jgi:hypothetical protein
VDLVPQAGEAVAQLEGVADELLRRGGGDAEGGAELGDAELRDQWGALSGDGFLVLAARDGERSGVVDRLRRVQVRPRRSERQLTGSLGVLELARDLDRGQQIGGREAVCNPSCRCCQPFRSCARF